MPEAVRRYSFRPAHRLRLPREFAAVYDAKVRESRGPLTVYALPNELGHPRLGMSVSRKVGNAVRRNRIRRLIRESFRLLRHDLPKGYDLVVVVRRHDALTLAEYQKLLAALLVRLHGTWEKRTRAGAQPPPPTE